MAVEAPGPWRNAAADTLAALPRDVRALLRPVEPDMLHLTVRFLGEVDEGSVDDGSVDDGGVPALVAALGRHVPPLRVRLALGAPDTFGPAARTGSAMLRVEGDLVALDALVARVDAAVREALGRPRTEERYQPHLTLGRLRRSATAAERRSVAQAVRALPPPPPAEFTATRAVLMRSHLGPGGARYRVEAAFA